MRNWLNGSCSDAIPTIVEFTDIRQIADILQKWRQMFEIPDPAMTQCSFCVAEMKVSNGLQF
jgi:hypothetical protein